MTIFFKIISKLDLESGYLCLSIFSNEIFTLFREIENIFIHARIQGGGNRVNRPHFSPLVYCIFNLKLDIYSV